MLDAVVDFLPSPIEVPAIKGIKYDNEEEAINEKVQTMSLLLLLLLKL